MGILIRAVIFGLVLWVVALWLVGSDGGIEAARRAFDDLFAGRLSIGDAATALYLVIVGQPLAVHIVAAVGVVFGIVMGLLGRRRRRARAAAQEPPTEEAAASGAEREPLLDIDTEFSEVATTLPDDQATVGAAALRGGAVAAVLPSDSRPAEQTPVTPRPQSPIAPSKRARSNQRPSGFSGSHTPSAMGAPVRIRRRSPIHRKYGELQATNPKMLETTPEPVPICKILNVVTLGICRFYTIPQGCVLTVSAFDKYRTFKKPGLRSILSLWSLYEQPVGLVSSKEIVRKYAINNVSTSDRVQCDIDVMLVYRISDPGKALFEVEDYAVGIENLADYVVREQGGMRRATELLGANREEMATPMLKSVKSDAQPWGIDVRLFQVTSIVPSGGQRAGIATV